MCFTTHHGRVREKLVYMLHLGVDSEIIIFLNTQGYCHDIFNRPNNIAVHLLIFHYSVHDALQHSEGFIKSPGTPPNSHLGI